MNIEKGNKTILLVEDEAIICIIAAKALKRFGYEVILANTGEKAVIIASENETINLVVMDINLGDGIDGTEAARRILAVRNIPIVFHTSHSEREMVEKVRGITRYGYVVKSSGDFVLQSSIEMAFDLFDAHESARKVSKRNDAILKTIPDMMFIIDCNGIFRDFSSNAPEDSFAISPEKIIGSHISDLFPPEEVENQLALFRECLRTGEVQNYSYTMEIMGKQLLFDLRIAKLDDEEVLAIVRDITEHRKAEAALKESESSIRKKLNAISEPEGDIATLDLDDIIDRDALQAMMNDFYSLTKIGCAITNISGKVLASVGWADICSKFHRVHPETLKNCHDSDVNLASGVPNGALKAYKCMNNMWDIVTPVEIAGRHMGNIYIGQFFYDDEIPDRELFIAQARQYGFDETEYLAALDRVSHLSHETVDTAMAFYSRIAGMVSSLSYSTVKLSRALSQKDIVLEELKQAEGKIILNNEELIAANEEMEAAYEELRVTGEELQVKDKSYQSEKIFTDALMECLPGYLYVYDDKGNLVRWNNKLEDMTGYTAEELSHMNMSMWFEGDDAVRVAAAAEQVFKTGYGDVEAHLLIKGGEKILFIQTVFDLLLMVKHIL